MPKITNEIIIADIPLTYTVKEAAVMLHTTPERLRRLINAGKIRAIKPTGTTLIYRKTLIEFLEKWEGWNLSDPYNPIKINVEE